MEDNKDFIIKDRRVFSQENEKKEEEEEKETQETETESLQAEDVPSTEESSAESQLPEVNFPTFIMSLNVSALANLGAIEDPTTGQKNKNLLLGKQTIDILVMLEEKTRGNLTNEEENMLKNILYDLRMIYVKEKE